MQQVYTALDPLDAQRFRNFLALRGTAAEVRELPIDDPAAPGSLASTVWVADNEAARARDLVPEFASLFEQSTEYLPEGSAPADGAENEPPATPRRIPWLTAAFCAACVFLSLGVLRSHDEQSRYEALRVGWRNGLEIADGSYWAIFTAPLLHISAGHLVMNLVAIAILGAGVERAFGRRAWLALYVVAAMGCTAAEMAATGRVGVGASGFLFALYGLILAASATRRVLPTWLLIAVSIPSLYGALFDVLETWHHYSAYLPLPYRGVHAHLAGLALGIVAGVAFAVSWKPWLTGGALATVLVAALVPLRGPVWLSSWLVARGEQAVNAGQLAAAIDWYSRAILRSRQPADLHIRRGALLIYDGRLQAALADFDAALNLAPRAAYARGYRAIVFEMQSRLDRALQEADDELDRAGDSAFAYAVRGSIHESRNEFDAGAKDCSVAIKLDPDVSGNWTNRSANRRESAEYNPALSDAEQAIRLDPQEPNARLLRGLVLLDRAEPERARVDLEEARRLFTKELTGHPRHPWLLTAAATASLEAFRLDKRPEHLADARAKVDLARQVAPDDWNAWQLSGTVEIEKGNFSDAERDLSRALELNGRDAISARLRGLARHKLGRAQEALEDFDRSLVVNPRSPHAWLGRARVRRALGDQQGAMTDVERAVQINPHFVEASRFRAELSEAGEAP